MFFYQEPLQSFSYSTGATSGSSPYLQVSPNPSPTLSLSVAMKNFMVTVD